MPQEDKEKGSGRTQIEHHSNEKLKSKDFLILIFLYE